MTNDNTTPVPASRPTVFLSYASEDREVAKLIRDALPGLGLEVWYDESALDGGDAWDQKIRRQIRECDLFMPVISAQTEARREGYFRREWRLAAERTLDMADDHIFLLPIVVDDTDQSAARVPEKFLSVQWTKLPGGQPTPAFEALCARLAAGQSVDLTPPRSSVASRGENGKRPKRSYPAFPLERPGHKASFYGRVFLWLLHSGWVAFMRWPRWLRVFIYVWVVIWLMSKGCTPGGGSDDESPPKQLSSTDLKALQDITDRYQSGGSSADVGQLAESIARQFPGRVGIVPDTTRSVLAIPFSAPADDPAAVKLADAAFAQVFGRLSIAHPGKVRLTPEKLPIAAAAAAAAARGRAQSARYALIGAVDPQSNPKALTVQWVNTKDGSVTWSSSYPVTGADAAVIAEEVNAKAPAAFREDD